MADLDYEYGYQAAGISGLLTDVNSIVLSGENSAANKAINGVADIKTVCDKYWEGTAKDNFIANLTKDAQTFANALSELEKAFATEIRNAGSDYKSFDENLIELK